MSGKKLILITAALFLFPATIIAQYKVPGFNTSPYYNEQVVTFHFEPEVKIHINAPSAEDFNPEKPVGLVLYALPNGSNTEQTEGKIIEKGDDWHFDIQHIAAQTRFLRAHITNYNLVIVYLETKQKSWPLWKAKYSDHSVQVKNIVEYLRSIFNQNDPFVILTGHSGGGRFIFSFLEAFTEIPDYIKRISFLDSNYGYEENFGIKIKNWLNSSDENYLNVIAYNDSIALYKGKTFVSPTGGTWYRSRIMKNHLSNYFSFITDEDNEFIKHNSLGGRIKFILKKNPSRQIFHTVQIERNGFIQGIVSGTSLDEKDYVYYGSCAYSKWIQVNTKNIQPLMIPPRAPDAKSGSEFMKQVSYLPFAAREQEILNEISSGNIPDFLRKSVKVEAAFNDEDGKLHLISYYAMPDYLAVGSDSDFCRIPMGPITAQKIAELFGAVLPTRKLVDNIYQQSEIKLSPINYLPVGNQNELVPTFIKHNNAIEKARIISGGLLGQLTGGIKKDLVLSNKIMEPMHKKHVVIYGWHQLNGNPIQPLSNIHINSYVDYSHGVRLINSEFYLDNKVKKIKEVLKDPVLFKIISDENESMSHSIYNIE